MPIPVADPQIEQARRQKRAGVDPILRAALHQPEHLDALDDLVRSGEPRAALLLDGATLNEAERAGKPLAELAQTPIVRQHH